jgi:hypothetical protein
LPFYTYILQIIYETTLAVLLAEKWVYSTVCRNTYKIIASLFITEILSEPALKTYTTNQTNKFNNLDYRHKVRLEMCPEDTDAPTRHCSVNLMTLGQIFFGLHVPQVEN